MPLKPGRNVMKNVATNAKHILIQKRRCFIHIGVPGPQAALKMLFDAWRACQGHTVAENTVVLQAAVEPPAMPEPTA